MDKDSDLDKLESNGPYPCDWENSWLGDGYYFWDTFIENAHWWGNEVRKYKNGYIICKAYCDFNDTECLDLVGSTEQLKMFKDSYELLKEQGIVNERTTVKRMLIHIKDTLKIINFVAVRAYGKKSKSYNSPYNLRMFFESDRPSYLDCLPPIQICFCDKKSMNLRNYTIVYPKEYINGYLV